MKVSFSRRFAVRSSVIFILTALSLSILSFVSTEQFYRAFLEPVIGLTPGLGIDLSNGITTLNVNSEHNIPTWFSTSLLLLCAVVLGGITYFKKQAGERYVRQWGGLSIIFAYLSMDEGAGIHEIASRALRSWLQTGGLLYYPWVILAAVLVVVFVLGYLGFLSHLPVRFRWLFIAAGATYVGGSLGGEIVGAYLDYSLGKEPSSLLNSAQRSIEEFMEMTGAALFLYSLMRYTDQLKEVAVEAEFHQDEKATKLERSGTDASSGLR